MRTTKPNYAERRVVTDLPEEGSPENEEDNEEKKMEETRVSAPNSADSEASLKSKESESLDSTGSYEDSCVVHETVSTDTSDLHARNDANSDKSEESEEDATIDITSTDTVSLFTRLLTITNKAGTPSGTVTMNLDPSAAASNPNDDDENKVITPTIMQNGRPVSKKNIFFTHRHFDDSFISFFLFVF